MSAVVLDLVDYAVRRGRTVSAGNRQTARPAAPTAVERCGTTSNVDGRNLEFCFWQGASGARYVHHVFSLIECPQVPAATYLLVGRDAAGKRVVLHIGCVEDEAQSLNLADIRHRGATLGANEVHAHLLGRDPASRQAIADDLRASLCGVTEMAPLSA